MTIAVPPSASVFTAEIIGVDLRQPFHEVEIAVIRDAIHDNAVPVFPCLA